MERYSEDQIPSARNNNLVAESDFHAAVSALRQNLNHTSTSDPVLRRLLTDCSNSLERNIQQIVQPISDEAYHVYLSRYKDNILSCPSFEAFDKTEVPGPIEANVIEDEIEFEEEDLLDHVAVARVQELRQQVREQAAKMVQLRNDTLQRAVTLTERQVQLWEKQNRQASKSFSGSHNVLLEQNKTALEDMKASFSKLHQTLQETGTMLPSQLQLFQSSLQEIECSLKQQPSQVDQAIFSREDADDRSADDVPMAEEFHVLDPEQKLAHLLCRN